ncbi:HEAT repeat domain-containing protein [Nostoc sp. CENA543]|uniref:HEAT repeat domain-containing protein n=1 Tax=Nostoc sp. CENA543 TaxID=1869241 RepID=UPI0012FFDE42|nr:HEAT repeat domain-containing protein [Nostoc sp. CENA543]
MTNRQAIAQTSLTQPQCSEVEMQQHIQQLNKGASADFDALVACDSKSVPALLKAMKTRDQNLRIIIIAALGEIGLRGSSAIPSLKLHDLLNGKNKEVRLMAANALKKIGQDPIPVLILALQNSDSQIRQQAAYNLGQLSTEAKDAIPHLINALKDPDKNVRFKAAYALEEIATLAEDAIPSLRNALKDPDISVRRHVSSILRKIRWHCYQRCYYSRPTRLREETSIYRANHPLAMCRIPVIRSVLKWKCS